MKLVVEIDETTYEDIKKGKIHSSIRDVPLESVNAIANGTPLPKGHGRLIDGDELESRMNIGYRIVRNAQTIIEADKEIEE